MERSIPEFGSQQGKQDVVWENQEKEIFGGEGSRGGLHERFFSLSLNKHDFRIIISK